jgi:uncharacterized glyoxalase superfamily protein PhnB
MAKTKHIPEGLHPIIPQLNVDGAAEAIAFYARAFGAEEHGRAMDPSGKKVWHAALRFDDSTVFVNDTMPEMGAVSNPSRLWFYVPDVDAAFKRATAAGAEVKMPPADMFWGDRICQVADRWGNQWNLATHVKDMTPEEMKAAQDAFVAQMQQQKGRK